MKDLVMSDDDVIPSGATHIDMNDATSSRFMKFDNTGWSYWVEFDQNWIPFNINQHECMPIPL